MTQVGEVKKKKKSFSNHRPVALHLTVLTSAATSSRVTGIQGVTEMFADAAGGWCGDERQSGPNEYSQPLSG